MPRAHLLVLAALLGGCAALPPAIPEVAECQINFVGIDGKVADAGARNAGAHPIEGFPYLRSNRFLASFRGEVDDPAKFQAWVEQLRQLDLKARESELRNVGWPDPEEELLHLDKCGQRWAERDLRSKERRAALREAAAVPDDYSLLRRTLGFYPVAVPFLNLGISGFNDDVAEDYARPLESLDSPGPLVLWQPRGPRVTASDAAHIVRNAQPDPLGIPQLTAGQWRALAEAHAPAWLIETGGDFDRIGAPQLRDGEPGFDAGQQVNYFVPGFTRFAGNVLVQLSYVAWFSERPPDGAIDSYAGTLDGVIWRVTLDTDGAPLLYDTIHACGCYHYYFLAKPVKRKPQGGFWEELVLFPQEVPAEPFAIRVQSRTHYVRRLVPLARLESGDRSWYSLADYDALLSLPDGRGGRRSLFREDGLAPGTDRFERFWLWPAGIESAGAMRQWGRHATSFVGRSHFDDPAMMERLFER